MEIKPIDGTTIGKAILNLDKILPDENPSIFIKDIENRQSTFNNKDLNNLLYDC